ncbi:Murein DD-endopeptidase MepH precursor [Pigmentiphaga humi]|uniref:Murein DD-endopeptidase MepH n=1 Tax=Pigmentiphaga humi TaxID=2478468 RepID=A0A3P4B8E7_9BURK|nr:C40 family peptidase [Pigmentiphaga humi]VCU71435.1 Murein DD-endopeptidase MepH precursor [Pigmentiphaga humi]
MEKKPFIQYVGLAKAGKHAMAVLGLAALAGCATQPATVDQAAKADQAAPASRTARYSLPSHPVPSWKDFSPVPALPNRFEADPAKILSGQWQEETPDDTAAASQAELAAYALNYLGIPYRSGGSSPDAGFDCSGLVNYVSREVLGLKLPRRAEEISRVGSPIALGDLQPGDLVFYNTLRRKFSHVGIYLGDGRFVHSPSTGGVVRIESMDLAYWKKRFNGARRLASAE